MNDKYLKFVDFIFHRLKDNYGQMSSFMDMAHYYKKEFDIEIDYDDTKYLKDKFFFYLFTPIGNLGAFELTPEAKDIIETYGTYSNYIESQIIEASSIKETNDLKKTNLKLDIENKEYLKTIRDQESKIRTLEIRLKRIELFKNYYWLLGIIFGLGVIIGKLWNVYF